MDNTDDIIEISKHDLIFIREAMSKNIQRWTYKDEVVLYDAIKKIDTILNPWSSIEDIMENKE